MTMSTYTPTPTRFHTSIGQQPVAHKIITSTELFFLQHSSSPSFCEITNLQPTPVGTANLRHIVARPLRPHLVISTPMNRSRPDFTTNNKSVGASGLADFSRQVGCRSQLMGSRLSVLIQASEASQDSPLPAERAPRRKTEKRFPHSAILPS